MKSKYLEKLLGKNYKLELLKDDCSVYDLIEVYNNNEFYDYGISTRMDLFVDLEHDAVLVYINDVRFLKEIKKYIKNLNIKGKITINYKDFFINYTEYYIQNNFNFNFIYKIVIYNDFKYEQNFSSF